jgi:spermidine synthase
LKTKVLAKVTSDISGEIRVEQNIFGRKLVVGNITQSITNRRNQEKGVWKAMVPKQEVKNALILGYGGGTVARLLQEKYPLVKISSYEIDQEVVALAKKFFNRSQIGNEIHIADARQSFNDKKIYDFVLIDLYIGSNHIKFTDTSEFMEHIKGKLTNGGTAAFMRIPIFESKKDHTRFKTNLRNVFNEITIRKLGSNKLYWVKK